VDIIIMARHASISAQNALRLEIVRQTVQDENFVEKSALGLDSRHSCNR
jgi:hypothetical protein